MAGEPVIPEHQLRIVLNFDETCLSQLDGSTIIRDGCPAACRSDPCLPQVGLATSKTLQTVTMIIGSNARGEALPPQFQKMTTAKTKMECRFKMSATYSLGLEEDRLLPVTFGINKKEDWTTTNSHNTFGIQ
jgi:hypothetical protein